MTTKDLDLELRRRARDGLRALAQKYPRLTSPEAQARLEAYLAEEMAKEERMTGKPRNGVALSERVTLRLAPADVARLDSLAQRIPIASRHTVARAAMRIGLAVLEADPTRIVLEGGLEPPPVEETKRPTRPKR